MPGCRSALALCLCEESRVFWGGFVKDLKVLGKCCEKGSLRVRSIDELWGSDLVFGLIGMYFVLMNCLMLLLEMFT